MHDNNLILVVDDDPSMLKGLQRLLRRDDYEPAVFSTIRDFQNQADIAIAACVMLDINLPDGSGIELGHRLKADGYSIPVIYMTGNDKPAIRDATLASGCIAFLTKPFSVDDLIGPLGKGIPVKLIYTLYRPAFPKGRGLILH